MTLFDLPLVKTQKSETPIWEKPSTSKPLIELSDHTAVPPEDMEAAVDLGIDICIRPIMKSVRFPVEKRASECYYNHCSPPVFWKRWVLKELHKVPRTPEQEWGKMAIVFIIMNQKEEHCKWIPHWTICACGCLGERGEEFEHRSACGGEPPRVRCGGIRARNARHLRPHRDKAERDNWPEAEPEPSAPFGVPAPRLQKAGLCTPQRA
ncbi:hypothetical protein SKAU_G00258070 [Synaphobranchus kaupii]|uniref:Uncharacterized protein n=1 Tax=Synaphobranchus kaupii TaxID=118154 RepID=A0A9Q1ISK9_SYNKA|nr:hypothetical protein SKAU_G00258070 [Synaphobranchus kaupii]